MLIDCQAMYFKLLSQPCTKQPTILPSGPSGTGSPHLVGSWARRSRRRCSRTAPGPAVRARRCLSVRPTPSPTRPRRRGSPGSGSCRCPWLGRSCWILARVLFRYWNIDDIILVCSCVSIRNVFLKVRQSDKSHWVIVSFLTGVNTLWMLKYFISIWLLGILLREVKI